MYPIAFNARVFREWRIVKDVDGSGRGLNVGSPLGGTEKGHETF
jgi:hypothetical protein